MNSKMKLYAVTDRTWLGERALKDDVELALKGGITFLQLRNKNVDDHTFIEDANEIKLLCHKYNVPLVINDRVDIALKTNADGVHIGQSDMTILQARTLLGPEKIIGVSVQTVEQALLAEKNGADYLGVGAAFVTSTKSDAKPIDHKILQAICQATTCPVVAIGGINNDNMNILKGSGINGVAVVSAIFGQSDIISSTQQLNRTLDELLGEK